MFYTDAPVFLNEKLAILSVMPCDRLNYHPLPCDRQIGTRSLTNEKRQEIYMKYNKTKCQMSCDVL